MKPYFFLLSVLYLITMYISLTVLGHAGSIPELRALKSFADVVLLSLCMAGCFGRAFGRRFLTPGFWNGVFTATLILGGFSVAIFGFGDLFGLPVPGGRPSLWTLVMIFLPYALFAGPVILYEYDLKHGRIGNEPKSRMKSKSSA